MARRLRPSNWATEHRLDQIPPCRGRQWAAPALFKRSLMKLNLNTKRHQIIVRLESSEDEPVVSKQAMEKFLDILASMVADAYLNDQSLDQIA
jgi:hypothetical protein